MPPNKRRWQTRRLIAVCFGCFFITTADAADLAVDITGLRSNEGTIMLGLYDTAAAFDRALEHYEQPDGFIKDTGRVVGAAIRVDTGIRRSILTGLKPGRYAIILFHDENQDGRLDKNLLGIPNEGFGFSNNVIGFFGPPSFEDALVMVPDGLTTTRVDLQY